MSVNIIKELVMSDIEDAVYAVSLVDAPAIEVDFEFMHKHDHDGHNHMHFSRSTSGFYLYTAEPEPETIDTSHPFCIQRAGKVYHASEINNWGRLRSKDYISRNGLIDDNLSWFQDFEILGQYNLNSAIYNCRHYLKAIDDNSPEMALVPDWKVRSYGTRAPKFNPNTVAWGMTFPFKFHQEFEFGTINEDKRLIDGPILIPNKMIYRNDVCGSGKSGYVFFSIETVAKLQRKYGLCNAVTVQHQLSVDGVRMTKSYIGPDNIWYGQYYVANDNVWNLIKSKKLKGFSVEIIATPK